MNIIERMDALCPEMSKTEKKVYQFIRQDPGTVIQYTIQQIAMMADTSVSAVQRFTKTLGFSGYKDFRYAVMTWKETLDDSGDMDLIDSLAGFFSDGIRELSSLDRNQIGKLCREIIKADKIILLGRYRNKTIADKLAMNLNDLGYTCICANGLIEFQHTLYITNENTCVIIFSAVGEIDDVKDYLEQLRSITKHTWIITNNKKPKMGKLVTNHISLPVINSSSTYPISSHFVVMAFVEILTVCLIKQRQNTGS